MHLQAGTQDSYKKLVTCKYSRRARAAAKLACIYGQPGVCQPAGCAGLGAPQAFIKRQLLAICQEQRGGLHLGHPTAALIQNYAALLQREGEGIQWHSST